MPCFAGEKASKVEPPARSSPEYQVDVSIYPVMKPPGFPEVSPPGADEAEPIPTALPSESTESIL